MHLMMLAFLIDQIQQRCCRLFQAALTAAKSKTRLWRKLRNRFDLCLIPSWEVLYRVHHRSAADRLDARHLLAERRERPCSKPLLRITKSQPFQQRRPAARGVLCPTALHTRPRRSRSIPGVHGGNCCWILALLDRVFTPYHS
jgi:hypothetical protein